MVHWAAPQNPEHKVLPAPAAYETVKPYKMDLLQGWWVGAQATETTGATTPWARRGPRAQGDRRVGSTAGPLTMYALSSVGLEHWRREELLHIGCCCVVRATLAEHVAPEASSRRAKVRVGHRHEWYLWEVWNATAASVGGPAGC